MAFQPIDIQVNVLQASNVAESVAHDRDEPKRARSEQSRKRVEERRAEENTSDETGEQNENEAVEDDESGTVLNRSPLAGEPADELEEDEEDDSRASEPDKGTHLDLTT